MALSFTLPSIGTLDTTLPDTSDPMYQPASLCLDIHKILKAAADQGMSISQAVASDFSTYETNIQSAIGDFMTRCTELLTTGSSSTSASLPSIVPLATAILAGGSNVVVPLLINTLVDVVLKQFNVRADVANGEPGGTVDFTDVVDKLDEVRAQIETTLTEFTINIQSAIDEQTFSVGPLDEE